MKFNPSRFVPKVVSRVSARQIVKVQKNSPHILFGVGVVGVVATAVLASRATLKLDSVLTESEEKMREAERLLAQNRSDYTEKDFGKDALIIRFRAVGNVAKLYALPVSVGVLSIACLAGSHHILNSRNVALTAAYATLEKSYGEYRERVVNQLGVEKEAKLYSEVVNNRELEAKDPDAVIVPGGRSIYSRMFNDQTSPSWQRRPEDNWFFIKCQENTANTLLHSRGHIFLNEVLDSLNLERCPEGQIVGWVRGNGDDHVDFGFFKDDTANNPFSYKVEKDGSILLDFNVDGPVYNLI